MMYTREGFIDRLELIYIDGHTQTIETEVKDDSSLYVSFNYAFLEITDLNGRNKKDHNSFMRTLIPYTNIRSMKVFEYEHEVKKYSCDD